MSTITWGRRERFTFTACGALNEWQPPSLPAVFAITYRRDPQNKPKGHTVFFFGECDDLAKYASGIKRKMAEVWAEDGGSSDDLYVFVHTMEGSTKNERARVQERLVMEYQPQVNAASV